MGKTAPWSEDKTFQETFFCNVFREDDKVTKWIRNQYHWPNQMGEVSHHELNMMVARMVNKPISLENMGWPFAKWGMNELHHFGRVMKEPGAWGGAYIVSTNGQRMPKWEYVQVVLTKAYYQLRAMPPTNTLAQAHSQLMEVHGLGSFMAAQVVADLKNTPGHILADAPDWWTWAAHGPGSLRGMAWVYGMDKCTPTQFKGKMPELRDWVDHALEGTEVPQISAQDLQNCLCEFDKYMRVSKGTGKSKRKYHG